MSKNKKNIFYCVFVLSTILSANYFPGFAQFKTLGPGSCGLGQSNCHTNENNWWKDDAHHATVDAFYDDPSAYEKIAQLAGVGAGNMFKGSQKCMSCHGTAIAGKEARETADGVSCESCHGPGSGYKDPHSEKPGGYEKALKLGMVELQNVDARANTCTRCHYITDQKLLAAGHPDGANFNYISGIKKVARHWKRQPVGEDLSKAPFEKAMRAKGPIAQIVKVEPVAATPAPPVTAPLTNATTTPPAKATVAATSPTKTPTAAPILATPQPTRQREFAKPPTTARVPEEIVTNVMTTMPLDLPPFPNISDTTSVPAMLLIVKKRLELLYQKTGGNVP